MCISGFYLTIGLIFVLLNCNSQFISLAPDWNGAYSNFPWPGETWPLQARLRSRRPTLTEVSLSSAFQRSEVGLASLDLLRMSLRKQFSVPFPVTAAGILAQCQMVVLEYCCSVIKVQWEGRISLQFISFWRGGIVKYKLKIYKGIYYCICRSLNTHCTLKLGSSAIIRIIHLTI